MSLHTDPGLQPERTQLAWTRTVISMLLVSAVMLRWAGVYGPAVRRLAGALLTRAVFIVSTQQRRYLPAAQGLSQERVQPGVFAVVALTAALLLLGIGGLSFVLADALG